MYVERVQVYFPACSTSELSFRSEAAANESNISYRQRKKKKKNITGK